METTVYVDPANFPWLVIAALDTMFETDFDFDIPTLSTLRPSTGALPIGGPQRDNAVTEIRRRLDAVGVRLSEVSLATR